MAKSNTARREGRPPKGKEVPAPPASTQPSSTPITLHVLHLVLLLGLLQPLFLLLSLFFLPQRALTPSLPRIEFNSTSVTSPLARGLHAISAIYDNPDHITGPQLRTKVLSATAIAVFITQAWLTRALGKWVAADQRRNAIKSEDTVSSTFESLAMSVLSLPISTIIFVLLLTLTLGAPIPFTDEHTIPTLTLAFHLALVIALPTSHILGSDWSRWDTVFLPAFKAPTSAALTGDPRSETNVTSKGSAWHAVLFYPVTGALLGAVLASFGLALDWGRPWQIWPLPPLIGSTAGLVVGNWLGIRAYLLQVSNQT